MTLVVVRFYIKTVFMLPVNLLFYKLQKKFTLLM